MNLNRNNPLSRRAAGALGLLAVASWPLAAALPAQESATVERRLTAMGTSLSLMIESESRPKGLRASERCVRAIEAVEDRLSTWNDESELAGVHRAAVGEPVALSPELAADLSRARYWWRETGGAFDPGVGSLVAAWGLRVGGRVPSSFELKEARSRSGFGHFELSAGKITKTRAGCTIEEGGFGKGVALDAAIASLAELGAHRALIDLGGQVAVLSSTSPFPIAIAHPEDRARNLLSLEITSGSCATSGNSERGIEVDGVRYGHLLDPRTGRPANDFGSLTVWAANATDADCLSTGLYVLGADAALDWAARHDGVEVIAIEVARNKTTEDGNERGALRVRATAGLAGNLISLSPAFSIEFQSNPPGDH